MGNADRSWNERTAARYLSFGSEMTGNSKRKSSARRASAPSATPVSVANSSCASVMRRLADSGKEARVPSSLAAGTGERSKEAAAEAEVATFRADADEVGAAIAGLAAEGGAGEDSALFPPIATRRVTLREELIDWAMKRGGRRGATEGSGKARWVSNSRNAV